MIKVENLGKPDNKKWKLLADILLYILPLEAIAIQTMPVSADTKNWILFSIAVLTPLFKAITKFTTNESTNEV